MILDLDLHVVFNVFWKSKYINSNLRDFVTNKTEIEDEIFFQNQKTKMELFSLETEFFFI